MAFFTRLVARFSALDVRLRKTLVFATGAASLLVMGLSSLQPAAEIETPTAPPRAEVSFQEAQLFVHLSGAVRHPGVYRLAAGSRVFDAVFAAGGLLKRADEASVNLARELSDGEQLILLTKREAVANSVSGDSPGGNTPTASRVRININRASAAELDSLSGIGPTLAQRIIDYRTANGGFRSIDDLDRVAGIGRTLLDRLRELVTL